MNEFINKNRLILFLLSIGISVRLISINQSLWMDEAISGYAVKNFSFFGIVENFIRSDTHPPFYYLLLKLWTDTFGYSEIALRFPSVIFGVLTIPAVYKLGQLFNKKTAVYSAIITTLSPLLIYYSQEARMYALSTFLVCLAVYFFLIKKWLLFSGFLLMLGMTDYLPLLILLPIWIFTIYSRQNKEIIRKLVFSQIPLFVYFTLWYPIFNYQKNSGLSFLKDISGFGDILGVSNLKNLSLVWIKFLIGRINFTPPLLYIFIVLIVSLLVLRVLMFSLRKIKNILFLWVWLLSPILTLFIISFKIPGFSYFRLLFTLPALILLLSFGLSVLKSGKRIIIILIALNLIFSGIYLFDRNFWREDWKTAVPFIEDRIEKNEKVLISYKESFTPYEWYSKKPGNVQSFYDKLNIDYGGIYTLDYLMDLTDTKRSNYKKLESLGYLNTDVYNFRGVGQVRYWVKN